MGALTIRCDDCGWTDSLTAIRHLRAWYRAACPECGEGEILDATEARVAEEMIALEREGLVALHDGPCPAGKVVMHLNTAEDNMISVHHEDCSK